MHAGIRVSLVVCVTALCALAARGRADAQEPPIADRIEVHVNSLLASDTQGALDALPVSDPLNHRLAAVLDYATYRLIKHQDGETRCGGAVAFNLPVGRILHVAPLEVESNTIVMDVVLFEGAHALLRTELKMERDGALILVGPRDPENTYITTIAVEEGGKPAKPALQAPVPPAMSSPQDETPIDLNPATPPQ